MNASSYTVTHLRRSAKGALLAALLTAAAPAGADPIKIDIVSGIPVGHHVRCTSTTSGGSSIDQEQTAGQDGRVSFLKYAGYNDIYYMDIETGKIVCDMGTNGGAAVADSIQIGDLFPLFASGPDLLTSMIDLTHTAQGLGLHLGDALAFSAGLCPTVPGMVVLDGGVPFTGTGTVGGFNTVAPTPGSLVLLGMAGLCARRRR